MIVAMVVIGAGWTDVWAAALWRASVQGGIVLALAWVITRAFARMSPAFKCWVWRVAYLKLLVALCWAVPIPLRVLPASRAAAPVVAGTPVETPTTVEPADVRPRATPAAPAPARTIVLHDALFAAWGAGALLLALRLAFGWRAARAIRRGTVAVDDVALLRTCAELATAYGLTRAPALAYNAALRSPLLLGPIRPLIVLPADAGARHPPDALRLMLAHELAHLKRRDLWWNWLTAVAQGLFFFHPLVWLAAREWRLAQESACDEAAVAATGTSPARYGDMLLDVIAGPRPPRRPLFSVPPATAAAGVAESRWSVRRRLTAMKHFNLQPPRRRSALRRGLAVVAVSLVATLSLVPLRLAAKEPAPPDNTDRPDVVPNGGPGEAAAEARLRSERAPEEETLLELGELSFLKSPEAELAAGADGVVRGVHVEVGQPVKKGDALVELDPARAVAELNLAKADLELKKLEFQRKQRLHAQGNKGINELELTEAEVGLKRAENLLAIKEHELEQTRVVAPFDGVVAKVSVRPGVFLARGGAAVTVVQTDTMWSEVELHPAALAILKKGTRAEMTPSGVPPAQEKTYLGRVTSISPVLRPGGQTGTVRVQFDTPPADLRPGTYVKVRFLRAKPGE
jgi:beta-lactamase regulating signal transducer with metallopeptidase domain/biotin carboxyl carrier protein